MKKKDRTVVGRIVHLGVLLLVAMFFVALFIPEPALAANHQIIDTLEGGSIDYTFVCRDKTCAVITTDYEIRLFDEDWDSVEAVEDKAVSGDGYWVLENLKVSTEYYLVLSSDGEEYKPLTYHFTTASSGNSSLDPMFSLYEWGDFDTAPGYTTQSSAGYVIVVVICIAGLAVAVLAARSKAFRRAFK